MKPALFIDFVLAPMVGWAFEHMKAGIKSMVVHTCNPSYMGGGNGKDSCLRPTRAKVSKHKALSSNPNTANNNKRKKEKKRRKRKRKERTKLALKGFSWIAGERS
jgi:hypothetical protein